LGAASLDGAAGTIRQFGHPRRRTHRASSFADASQILHPTPDRRSAHPMSESNGNPGQHDDSHCSQNNGNSERMFHQRVPPSFDASNFVVKFQARSKSKPPTAKGRWFWGIFTRSHFNTASR